MSLKEAAERVLQRAGKTVPQPGYPSQPCGTGKISSNQYDEPSVPLSQVSRHAGQWDSNACVMCGKVMPDADEWIYASRGIGEAKIEGRLCPGPACYRSWLAEAKRMNP